MEDDCKLYTVPPERIIARLMKEQTEFKETIRNLQERILIVEEENEALRAIFDASYSGQDASYSGQDAPEPNEDWVELALGTYEWR